MIKYALPVALVLASSSANAAGSQVFTGVSFTEDSYYSYLGGVTALNGDLHRDGVLLRASGAWGEYSYSRTGNTDVDGDITAGDLMIGYHAFMGKNCATLFVGGDYQNHDLSPNDTLNRVNGSELGLKAQAEVSLSVTDNVGLDLIGSYSGAYNTYWSRAQLGYNLGNVTVGPEVAALGSESYDQQRYGVFVKDIAIGSAKLGASAGYVNSERRAADDGAYGEVGLSFAF